MMKSCFNTRAIFLLITGCLSAIIIMYLFNILDKNLAWLAISLVENKDPHFYSLTGLFDNATNIYFGLSTVVMLTCWPIAYLGICTIKSNIKCPNVPQWAYGVGILTLVFGIAARYSYYRDVPLSFDKATLFVILRNMLQQPQYAILTIGICMPIFMKANRPIAYIGAVLCGLIFFFMYGITHEHLLMNLSTTLIIIMLCGSRLFDIKIQSLCISMVVMELIAFILGSNTPIMLT